MNYFETMTKKFGENWIVALKPEDIQRSGKRICREMVKGQIDYEKFGKYFLDSKFSENLIISCQNEMEINTLYFNAVQVYMQMYPNTPNIAVHLHHLQCLCYVYNTILIKLNLLKQTGNIGCLADTAAMLYSYRSHLN